MGVNFQDPIRPKAKQQKKSSPWDYKAPEYDERSSCYVNAGSHYGVGYKNPVGHTGNPKARVPTMPFGKREGIEVDEVPRKNLKQEYTK